MNSDPMSSVVTLLADLVAQPTVSETPNGELITWLGNRLEELGASTVISAGASGRASLVATIGPDTPGGIMLAGHTDVVPPGSGWRTDPWTLQRDGDRLFGRGTADMKGFFAAVLGALSTVRAAALAKPIRVVASYDEEIGCRGVRDLLPLLAGDRHFLPEVIIVGEPTMMTPRHRHLGKRSYRLAVRAAAAHSSRAGVEISAISVAADLIRALDAIQRAAPTYDGAPPFTVNCGTVRGGTQTNVIAAQCEMEFEVRHDTDHDPDDVLQPLWRAVDQHRQDLARCNGGIDITEIVRYPAMTTDRTAAVVQLVERLCDRGPAASLGFGTEGGLYAETIGAPVIICGPGDIADAHRPDEFVDTAQLARCMTFVEGLIAELCH